MEVGTQIKKFRQSFNLSQEELAEKVYVSRQTISNWETGKNYPDIHSLLLLKSLFNVSLDELLREDIEFIKEEIQETEIKKLHRYGMILGILMAAVVISAVPLAWLLKLYGFIPWGILVVITGIFAHKTEMFKKDHHIQTYKEIAAFMEGRRLDGLETQQEKGKLPYQRFLLALASALIAFLVCLVLAWWLLD